MIAPYLLRPIIVLGLLALAVGPASTLVNLRRAPPRPPPPSC